MSVVFLILLGLSILFTLHPLWAAASGLTKEVLITLTVVAGIHVLDRILFFDEPQKPCKALLT